MGTVNTKILKNEYVYSILSRLVSITLSFIHSIVIARYLGAGLRGSFAYITSVISIGSIVVTFGIHQAYPYFRKKYGKNVIYEDFLTIVIILYSIFMIIAVFLSAVVLDSIELKVATLLIPIFGYSNVMAYVSLVETPNKRNRWWMVANFVSLALVLILWRFTFVNMTWVIVILFFEEAFKGVIYTFSVKPHIHIHKGLWKLTVELYKFGFIPMLALLMSTLNYKIDVLMLRSFDFITISQIGIYSIGIALADKIALIPDTLQGVLVSKLTKGADEHEVAKVSRICFWATLLCFLAFFVMGDTVIKLFYGPDYDGAYEILMICSFGTIFIGYFKLISQYNIVNKMQIRNIALLAISIAVNVILNYILIPKYELRGAALASGVGYFLSGWIFVVWFAKHNRIRLTEMFMIQKNDIDSIKKIISKRKIFHAIPVQGNRGED